MRKIVVLLLMGLIFAPSEMLADKYNSKRLAPMSRPARTQPQYCIYLSLDESTGDLVITPSNDITGLNITITANGVTYLDTTVLLGAGQSYTDCLDFLNVGTYILTLSTADGIIDQYEITVEDD